MRVLLIHNEDAGEGEPTKTELLTALCEGGYDPVYCSGSFDADRSLQGEIELVAVAGGDGTVASVAKQMAGRGIPLAVIPVGTANNIASVLGIRGPWRDQIAGWKDGARRSFDLGRVNGRRGDVPFIEAVGCGLIADLIVHFDYKQPPPETEGVADELDLARQELRKLLQQARPRHWRVELDGESLSGPYLLVEAMNIGRIGPGVVLAPDADPGDGLLDVVLLAEKDRAAADKYLQSPRPHEDALLPPTIVRRARKALIDAGDDRLHVDDKPWPDGKQRPSPEGPVRIWLEPHAISFILPSCNSASPTCEACS